MGTMNDKRAVTDTQIGKGISSRIRDTALLIEALTDDEGKEKRLFYLLDALIADALSSLLSNYQPYLLKGSPNCVQALGQVYLDERLVFE